MNADSKARATSVKLNGAENTRREFFSRAGMVSGFFAAAATARGASTVLDTTSQGSQDNLRRAQAYHIREQAALSHLQQPVPPKLTNRDEDVYPNKVGSYSKGLLHNALGEVDLTAYQSLLRALSTGNPDDFENVVLGGTVLLANPQAGLAFDIEGTDSHQSFLPPAPALASAWRGGEAVELYWQALLRDIPFSQYSSDLSAQSAITDINQLSDFRGPRDPVTQKVTTATLFRGFTAADVIGPYVSQFLYQPFNFGALPVTQSYQTALALTQGGADFLTDGTSWLAVQNGQAPFPSNRLDPTRRFLRSGRDLGQYVHVDVVYESILNACLVLFTIAAPFAPSNPYSTSKTQSGFATFGTAHVATLLAEVTTRALRNMWFEKWFVHRTLRPEEYGGLLQNTLTGVKNYPLSQEALNSSAMAQVFSQNGTFLLPLAYPEGCPQHPSYGQGHAVIAGACVSILKAFFDETHVFPNPVVPTDDGLSLVSYTGSDAGRLTVGGELNKLASNIGLGRNLAGVHWRSDYQEGLLLGERVAVSVLADQKETYNERFSGFTFSGFNGHLITV